jgi:hypothetical protein
MFLDLSKKKVKTIQREGALDSTEETEDDTLVLPE